jgi:hypothetical protein
VLKYYIRALLAGIAALGTACGDNDPPPTDCTDDRCNSAEDRDALLQSIEGFADPISTYLRDAVLDDGTLSGDYRDILDGVGTAIGCDVATQRSFVVLSNEALNPKTVFNRCASSPTSASEFFLLLPSLGADRDVEPRLVHMTAWDDTAGRYRRYATAPGAEGGMNVNVEPVFCLGCHAGPRQLGTWQPLMNEMTNPWSQWNAEPGFASHVFDEFFPPNTSSGPVYAEVSAAGLLDSASNLEPIIRAGIDRVTGARVQDRKLAPDAAQALELLQPLFCDEHVNFVSEIHGSGEFRSSALIDDAFGELFTALDVGQEHAFTQGTTMRITPQGSGEDNLTLMAVRGESSLRAELALVTRQALTPLQALQVRSLDWMTPVDSSFRCSLFEEGETRILAGALDAEIAALPLEATNEQLLPIFLAEIMSVEVAGMAERLSLQPGGDSVYSLPDAAAVDPADYTTLELSPAQLAAELQLAIDSATREELDQRRRTRACAAAARYPTAPIVSDVPCP